MIYGNNFVYKKIGIGDIISPLATLFSYYEKFRDFNRKTDGVVRSSDRQLSIIEMDVGYKLNKTTSVLRRK